MPYKRTIWVNNVTPVNADNLNKIERQLVILDEATETLQREWHQLETEGTHTHLNKDLLDNLSDTAGELLYKGATLKAPPYVHPPKHSASIIEETPEKVFLSTNEKVTLIQGQAKATYIHDQQVASNVWTIQHNMDRHPTVTVVDTANSVVIGEIAYLSLTTVRLTFSAAFSGKAYFN